MQRNAKIAGGYPKKIIWVTRQFSLQVLLHQAEQKRWRLPLEWYRGKRREVRFRAPREGKRVNHIGLEWNPLTSD